MKKDEIKIRYVSADEIGLDVNTAVGLSSNGGVHPIPTENKDGSIDIVNFYTESGQHLPRSYYETMIKNKKLVVAGLKGEQLIKMTARLAEIETYLKLTDK